jgi:4-hydroxybenzoate polyprenyltransferase
MKVSDFPRFIRLGICLFFSFVSVAGYLLFNSFSYPVILYVAMCAFLLAAGNYAYNNMRDAKEDKVNRGYSPPDGKSGFAVVGLCFFFAIMLSSILLPNALVLALLSAALGLAYSFFRIKEITGVKNIYTGLVVALVFLLGASAVHFSISMLAYYFSLVIFFAAGSIVSDMRDIRGDKAAGIKTLPAMLGVAAAKKITYLVFILLFILVVLLRQSAFYVLIPFSLLTVLAIKMNRMSLAHNLGAFSVVGLVLYSTFSL